MCTNLLFAANAGEMYLVGEPKGHYCFVYYTHVIIEAVGLSNICVFYSIVFQTNPTGWKPTSLISGKTENNRKFKVLWCLVAIWMVFPLCRRFGNKLNSFEQRRTQTHTQTSIEGREIRFESIFRFIHL